METVLRATAIYLILLIVLRMAGRRTLGEMTSFDFVLLLIIGEATQQALLVERLRMARITEDDVLEAARRLQGLERMDQIKYAVIEVTGGISIIPQEPEQGRDPR